jgi:hypothetical protein
MAHLRGLWALAARIYTSIILAHASTHIPSHLHSYTPLLSSPYSGIVLSDRQFRNLAEQQHYPIGLWPRYA